jgi:hypothetical protein
MIGLFIPLLLLEIFSVYFFINLMFFNNEIYLWVVLDITFWDLFLVVPPHIAIIFCSHASNKAEKITKHLEKFSSSCDDVLTAQKVNYLLNKLYNRKLIFSCGFFNINLQLGLSIVSTVTTYMVIIFQFQVGGNKA